MLLSVPDNCRPYAHRSRHSRCLHGTFTNFVSSPRFVASASVLVYTCCRLLRHLIQVLLTGALYPPVDGRQDTSYPLAEGYFESGWADRTALIAALISCPALMAAISFWSAHVAVTIYSLTCSSRTAAIRFYMSAMVSYHVGSNTVYPVSRLTPVVTC